MIGIILVVLGAGGANLRRVSLVHPLHPDRGCVSCVRRGWDRWVGRSALEARCRLPR